MNINFDALRKKESPLARYNLTMRNRHPCWFGKLVNWKDHQCNSKEEALKLIQEHADFFRVPLEGFLLEDSLLRFAFVYEDGKFIPHDKSKLQLSSHTFGIPGFNLDRSPK